MIYTSYFAKLKSLPKNVIPISICAKAPDWYKGLQYKKLAPKYDLLMSWKETKDEEHYMRVFHEQILGQLDAHTVINELYEMLPEQQKTLWKMTNCPCWENPMVNIALICFEKPTDFCHRHLVANWFQDAGIEVEEWS